VSIFASSTVARIRFAFAGALALTLVVFVFASTTRANTDNNGTDQTEQQTQQEFAQEGQIPYSGRAQAVQAPLNRMYDNDSHYHTLSAFFVSHEPGRPPGSEWINITQPSYVRTEAFSNTTGSGTPIEETQGQDGTTTVCGPGAAVCTENSHPTTPTLLPLSEVPLSIVEVDFGPTDVDGMTATQSILANDFIHPAALVTSPFVTDKSIALDSSASFDGRPAWLLTGSQVPGAPVATDLGDSWRMWVDKASGIILRLEYYSGSTMLGWADFQVLSIDGSGVDHNIGPLHLPASMQKVTPDQYASKVADPLHRSEATRGHHPTQ